MLFRYGFDSISEITHEDLRGVEGYPEGSFSLSFQGPAKEDSLEGSWKSFDSQMEDRYSNSVNKETDFKVDDSGRVTVYFYGVGIENRVRDYDFFFGDDRDENTGNWGREENKTFKATSYKDAEGQAYRYGRANGYSDFTGPSTSELETPEDTARRRRLNRVRD